MRRPRTNTANWESPIKMKCPNLGPPLWFFIDWEHLGWMWPWHEHWGRSEGAAARSCPPTVSCKHILLKGIVILESGNQCIRVKPGLELRCPCSFPILIYYKVLKIRNWNWIKVRYSRQSYKAWVWWTSFSGHAFGAWCFCDLKVNDNVWFSTTSCDEMKTQVTLFICHIDNYESNICK